MQAAQCYRPFSSWSTIDQVPLPIVREVQITEPPASSPLLTQDLRAGRMVFVGSADRGGGWGKQDLSAEM
jgi:hypothetical protein